ncbi:unnamed protein product [Diplocarpon coronariae]
MFGSLTKNHREHRDNKRSQTYLQAFVNRIGQILDLENPAEVTKSRAHVTEQDRVRGIFQEAQPASYASYNVRATSINAPRNSRDIQLHHLRSQVDPASPRPPVPRLVTPDQCHDPDLAARRMQYRPTARVTLARARAIPNDQIAERSPLNLPLQPFEPVTARELCAARSDADSASGIDGMFEQESPYARSGQGVHHSTAQQLTCVQACQNSDLVTGKSRRNMAMDDFEKGLDFMDEMLWESWCETRSPPNTPGSEEGHEWLFWTKFQEEKKSDILRRKKVL